MKRLILIRHAKSSWDAPFDDHARTLDVRGRAAATRIGLWLREQGYLPDAVYSSDAARTRETTDRVVAALGTTPDIHLRQTLYHGSPAALMEMVKSASGDMVAVVAHNPGIAQFAETIVTSPPSHDRFWAYPTGATLVCDIPVNDWADAVPRSAHVVDFIVPKDLSD